MRLRRGRVTFRPITDFGVIPEISRKASGKGGKLKSGEKFVRTKVEQHALASCRNGRAAVFPQGLSKVIHSFCGQTFSRMPLLPRGSFLEIQA
ncbi:MAG: hypothetical protein LBO00_02565, partial [Zoogloeaceae bacterium]|nr:hypothetical protein [Zoogloeaceae bacterium]